MPSTGGQRATKETGMVRPELPRTLSRKGRRLPGGDSRERRAGRFLVVLLALCALLGGCGSYASQAEKYSTEARSEVAGTAYVLEQFSAGEVSAPFIRSSLQQYARAMQQTAKSLRNLNPPPSARTEHERGIEALSRAQTLVQEAGREGVQPKEAPELAQRLERFGEEMKSR